LQPPCGGSSQLSGCEGHLSPANVEILNRGGDPSVGILIPKEADKTRPGLSTVAAFAAHVMSPSGGKVALGADGIQRRSASAKAA
jgi:hypothetical protein